MTWVGVGYYGECNYYELVNCIRHCDRASSFKVRIRIRDPVLVDWYQNHSLYVPVTT